ncbi:protein kinase domain-containing protein [Rothia sp. P13129]|uniref:protein kinase domain-containing protein n=1 Tax=unclassified Rothia (in: high G+C Gram-positive bacteria) TaxID=2689056 RepID=UPI003ACBF091
MSTQPENYPRSISLDQYATFRYSLGATQQRSLWAVSYLPEEGHNPLSIPEGNYALEEIFNISPAEMRPAERLCSLPTHEDVATVFAISSAGDNEYIWYEQTDAGTLENLLSEKGKITPEEVTGMVEQLCRGLRWLHEQQMAYRALNPRNIGFTSNGKLKLYAPERELRGATKTVIEEYIRHDTSALASIIWRCLTGEEPANASDRTPLHFLYPTMNKELMYCLEAAIDHSEQMPQLHEIYRLLAHEFVPRPVNLFASAHPQTHGTLPAEHPWNPPTPEQKTSFQRFFGRKSIEVPSALDLNQDVPSHRMKKFLSGKITRLVQLLSQRKILWGAVAVFGTFIITMMYGVSGLSGLPLAEPHQEKTHTTPSSEDKRTVSLPQHSDAPSAQQDSSPSIYPDPPEGEELAELLDELLHKRQESFSQNHPLVNTYAVKDSPQYLADMALHERDTQRELGEQSVKLTHIQQVQGESNRIEVQADIVSSAHSAKLLTDEEKQRYGIKTVGEHVQQTVRFTLLPDDTTWKIYDALPLNGE